MLFWKGTKGLNQNRKKKYKSSSFLISLYKSFRLWIKFLHLSMRDPFFLKHVVDCGTQNEIVNVKLCCLQKWRDLCFLVIYDPEALLSFWSLPHHHHILHVLFCANIVLVVSNTIITTWLCLCWRHWDVVEDSRDSTWSLPLFLWLSPEAVVKETSTSSPQSLPTLVLPWVGFWTPVPKMTITAI